VLATFGRDANRLWRGRTRRQSDLCRGTARRSGGSEGKPFVGPAGGLLDKALVEAGIDRTKVYATNAVKHFKWEPRGKRRIHKKPNAAGIAACRPWLHAEISALKPKVVVCLGATAAQALLGRDFRVTQRRSEFIGAALAPFVMATVHPSSILRAPDDETPARRDAALRRRSQEACNRLFLIGDPRRQWALAVARCAPLLLNPRL
jgi:uracil-DNA glycosylase family protein